MRPSGRGIKDGTFGIHRGGRPHGGRLLRNRVRRLVVLRTNARSASDVAKRHGGLVGGPAAVPELGGRGQLGAAIGAATTRSGQAVAVVGASSLRRRSRRRFLAQAAAHPASVARERIGAAAVEAIRVAARGWQAVLLLRQGYAIRRGAHAAGCLRRHLVREAVLERFAEPRHLMGGGSGRERIDAEICAAWLHRRLITRYARHRWKYSLAQQAAW